MSFERTQYAAAIMPAAVADQAEVTPDVVDCQSFVVVYTVNGIPTAKIDLPSGYAWGSLQRSRIFELLRRWSDAKERLAIVVTSSTNNTQTDRVTIQREILFEGYLLVPTLELLKSGAGYSFQLHHFLSDLAISSLMINYAMPSHPNEGEAANMYAVSDIVKKATPGGADLSDPSSGAKVEGIAWQLGLPPAWKQIAVDDIWGNVQKPILKALLEKHMVAQTHPLLGPCRNALNRPSVRAAEALQRIDPVLSDNRYASPVYGKYARPLAISNRIPPELRYKLGEQISIAIGNTPVNQYSNSNAWEQILGFCAEFSLMLVPRATSASIIPLNIGLNTPYDVEIQEIDYAELSATASQQINLRGVGVVGSMTQVLGNAVPGVGRSPLMFASGCFQASESAEAGLLQYQSVPRWLTNLPPQSYLAAGARTQANSQPFTPAAQPLPPDFSTTPEQDVELYGNLFNDFAQLRYLQMELAGRTVQVGGRFRTDIAPGSVVRVKLDPNKLNMQTSLVTEDLIGMVTSVTLAISRSGARAFTAFQIDFACAESQLSNPAYTINQHPFFTNIKGMPLTDPRIWQETA